MHNASSLIMRNEMERATRFTNPNTPYTIVLHPDLEEGGYGVTVPSLPGLMAEGNTRDEAIQTALLAIENHLIALAAAGHPIPPPDENPQVLVVDTTALIGVWV